MIEYIWQDLIFPLILNLIQQQQRQLNNKFFSSKMSCKMPPAAWSRKYTLILLIAVPVPCCGGIWGGFAWPTSHISNNQARPGLGYLPLWHISPGWTVCCWVGTVGRGWWKLSGFALVKTSNVICFPSAMRCSGCSCDQPGRVLNLRLLLQIKARLL